MREKVQEWVEAAVKGRVSHVESVPIIETFRGQTVWQGIVEVFKLEKPPHTPAYGWAVKGDGTTDFVAIVGDPPINTPLAAVRAWIASQAKGK